MNLSRSRAWFQRLLRTTWFKLFLGLLFCLILTLAALPFALKAGLSYWLVQNGAEQAKIDRFFINPFLGKLSLQGLQVDKDGKDVLSNTRFDLDLGLTDLLRRQIHVQRAVYDKLHLDLEQLADGRWRLTSYTLSPSAAVETPAAAEAGSAWHFLAGEVRMTDCLVHLKTPQMRLEVAIEEAELQRFTTRPGDGQGSFRLKGAVNGAPVELALDSLAINPHLRLNGTVKASGFGLDHLAGLLAPVLPTFAGVAAIDGQIQLSQPEVAAMEAVFDGQIALTEGHLGNPDFAFSNTGLGWQGKITYNGKGGSGTVSTEGRLNGEGMGVTLPASGMTATVKTLLVEGPVQATFGSEVVVQGDAALTLGNLEIGLATTSISAGQAQWQGKTAYAGGGETTGQRIILDGQWQTAALAISLPDSQLRHTQERLIIEGKTEAHLGKSIQTGFDGRIVLEGGDLRMPTTAVVNKEVSWKGRIGYAGEDPGKIELDGTFDGRELSLSLPKEDTTVTQQALSLEPRGSLTLGGQPAVKGSARLLAEATRVTTADGKDQLAALEKLTVVGIEAPGGSTVSIKQIAGQGLEVNSEGGEMPLVLRLPELAIDALACKEWSACSAQAIKATSFRAAGRRNNADLIALRALTVERPEVAKDGQVSAAALQLEALAVLPLAGEKNRDSLRLGRGRLTSPSWSLAKGFQGQALILHDLVAHVIRQKDGQLQANKQLAALRIPARAVSRQAAESPKESAANNAGLVELGVIKVQGASLLHFEDRFPIEPYIGDVALQSLEITDLSSVRPDQPAKITIGALLNQRAPLQITGTAKPFLSQPDMDLAFSLKNYPLSKLSPYTIQSVGLAMASGQLNLTGRLVVSDGHMDMTNGLELKKIETKTISAELAKQLDNRLPLPLESAISFLKDSNGDLKLDIPIHGPLSELDVGIADLLITALGKAIVPAASSYLVYSLGPYGALAYVGMKVGEKMLRASLAPVVFEPGKMELTAEHRDYLERVAKVLTDRPGMEINVCPVVPVWELLPEKKRSEIREEELTLDERNKEQLTRLGQERAQMVIDHLVGTHGIAGSRLLICETALPTAKDRKPEVELQL